MIVDSHCHLDFPDFADDLDAVVARARAAGVGLMQTICTRVTRFDQVRAIAERYDDIYCSVGIHPHNAAEEPPVTARDLAAIAEHEKVIGIGETGLDYYYEHSPKDDQLRNFRAHIAAARDTGLPLIVHSRDADTDTAEVLRAAAEEGAFPGLIHCFSAGRAVADAALALGLYISISGIVTFKNATELKEIVADLPLDRLLVETDAPFLAPVPKRGKRNEPALVTHTADCVAELKGMAPEEVIARTTENFFRLFRKVPARVAA